MTRTFIPQAGKLDRTTETIAPHVPVPDGSLVAAAQRITKARVNERTQVGRGRSASPARDTAWQADAWDMYDLVTELQFLVNVLARRTAQARVFIGALDPADPTADPTIVDDPGIQRILTALADSPKQLRRLFERLSQGLRVAGEGWLVGVPSALMPMSLMTTTSLDPRRLDTPRGRGSSIDGATDLDDLEWRALSSEEVSFPEAGKVTLLLGGGPGEDVTVDVDSVILIRVHQPHPRLSWEPDCPVRSMLPVLRTLVGLDMRSAAQIDSRLAGAGMLLVPHSAQQALVQAAAQAAGVDPGAVDPDQFTQALMLAMLEPIRDRSKASALVPIVATVPDESVEKFDYMDFAKPLDEDAPVMTDQAIRRVALGMDAPPEILTGVSGMNHWGAWLSSIETVMQHVAPNVELICDALTTQYLWPVLISSLGMSEAEAKRHVVWYEVEHLIVRPNRAGEAIELFDRGVIGAAAVRRAAGFEESDAPGPGEPPPPAVVPARPGGDGSAPPTTIGG